MIVSFSPLDKDVILLDAEYKRIWQDSLSFMYKSLVSQRHQHGLRNLSELCWDTTVQQDSPFLLNKLEI